MSNQLPLQPLLAQRDGRFAIEGEGALLWAREACRAVELCTCLPNAEVKTALFARQAIKGAAERALTIAKRAG